MATRIVAAVLATLALQAGAAPPQQTTAEGLQAIVLGDYVRAAKILRAMADGPNPDPVAQFFLGTMYESGKGVRINSLIACGLYRAAAQQPNPFATHAQRLADAILQPMPPFPRTFCTTDERVIGPGGSLVVGQPLPPGAGVPGNGRAEPLAGAGVEAFLRGDYASAPGLLEQATGTSDLRWDEGVIANFFLATMYESGSGLARDPIRACALYMRAASGEAPISIPSLTLWRSINKQMSPEDVDNCQFLARAGFNNGFQPAAFELGPAYSIRFDTRGATIHYQNADTHVDVGFGLRGARYLPIQYSELTANRTEHRHFIEIFRWLPFQPPLRWTLLWEMSEVVRNELVQVATEPIATTADGPPRMTLDGSIRDLVRLSVTPDGEVEVDIRGGDHPRAGVIDSEVDRQEARQQAEYARAAAAVDESQTLNLQRPPSFSYGEAEACGSVAAQAWAATRDEVLSLRADADTLGISAQPQTFDIAEHQREILLVAHVYGHPIRRSPFCTDVHIGPMPPEELWTATRGHVSITRVKRARRLNGANEARLTVTIEGAEFVNRAGGRVQQRQPITFKANVALPSQF